METAALLGVFFALALHAADWPQWRHDANRSGATSEACAESPVQLWHAALPQPDPAYDHQFRMCADVTYAPVAAHGLVFVPSSVADQVVARDLKSGRVVWRFFAEAPVRMAPVCAGETVLFGSDDGYLYAVTAKTGQLRWKRRGAPEALPDSRLLVNDRLCSRWPVRGAPTVHGGYVFFGAGVWPEEGVYICAVSVKTGEILWRRDQLSYLKEGMSDHGRAFDLSLPPQGYPAVVDGKLAVTSGRTLPAWFDLKTGEMEPYTSFYVKVAPPRGTWYLAGIGRYWVQGGNWFGTRSDAAPALPPALVDAKSPVETSRRKPTNETYVLKNRPFLGADIVHGLHNENRYSEPVLTEAVYYASEHASERDYLVPRGHTRASSVKFDRIVARDLAHPRWSGVVYAPPWLKGKKKTIARLQFPVLWELKGPWQVLIKAADRLYAGSENTLVAINIPEPGEQPTIAWKRQVNGRPINALVVDGTLVIATHTGDLYAFGAGNPEAPATTTATREPIRHRSPRGGFALVVGWGDGKRARDFAKASECRVVVLEADSGTAAKARRELAADGLYGRGVQILNQPLADLQFTPYWANQVIVNSLAGHGVLEDAVGMVVDLMRPFSGQLEAPKDRLLAPLQRLLAKRPGYTLEVAGDVVRVRRQAPPLGADEWTHEAGGADNAFASSDQLVKWPLGLLWYSGTIDRFFSPDSHYQHERNPYPLVSHGRMFLITGQFLHAVDIYTGSYLWKVEIPQTPWVQTYAFDNRVYGRPTDRNYVAAPDRVYMVTGRKLNVYDTATGDLCAEFDVPGAFQSAAIGERQKERVAPRIAGPRGVKIAAAPAWTELRLHGDLILTMFGNHLVGMDRHDGTVRWSRQSTRQTTTYAIGNDKLFGLDCDVPAVGGGEVKMRAGQLFALNPETGAAIWQKPLDYAPVPKHQVVAPRPWLRPVLPVLMHNQKHGLLVLAVNGNELHAFKAVDGAAIWARKGDGSSPRRVDIRGINPPVVTDDYVLISRYKGLRYYLLDVRSGKEVGDNTGIPSPRTCARVVGNNNLLVYRDAATELYDINGNRMIGLNSVRSGCTTSFIPAGGIMTAPMLGHGCVCNYPMFASMAMFHMPSAETFRPKRVTSSWRNQVDSQADPNGRPPVAGMGDTPVDPKAFSLIDSTLVAEGKTSACLTTKEGMSGYAIKKLGAPVERATFTFRVARSFAKGRHGNAFFVCGNGDKPENWLECKVYYGGRGTLELAGPFVEPASLKADFSQRGPIAVKVTVDCRAGTVQLQAVGEVLSTKLRGKLASVTHIGYGGSNSASIFSAISMEKQPQ